jgi:hypothetical protein
MAHNLAVLDLVKADALLNQPSSVRAAECPNRDSLIVSFKKQAKGIAVLSRYGEENWAISGGPTNTKGHRYLRFQDIPQPFREEVKALMYRLLRRGRGNLKPPGVAQLVKIFRYMGTFCEFLDGRGISSFSQVSAAACADYVIQSKNRLTGRKT